SGIRLSKICHCESVRSRPQLILHTGSKREPESNSLQKFSIIHALLFRAIAVMAKWRPSGEGRPRSRAPTLPPCSQSTRALPCRSIYKRTLLRCVELELIRPFPSTSQLKPSRLSH